MRRFWQFCRNDQFAGIMQEQKKISYSGKAGIITIMIISFLLIMYAFSTAGCDCGCHYYYYSHPSLNDKVDYYCYCCYGWYSCWYH
ncbi:MAG: hypothetical protein BGO54_06425 [Sphingobacteriales bacterium 46-32]|nr:MAG: hypothetical protein BGO54_06425 [Sphingobacteriales bacterium 46-32]